MDGVKMGHRPIMCHKCGLRMPDMGQEMRLGVCECPELPWSVCTSREENTNLSDIESGCEYVGDPYIRRETVTRNGKLFGAAQFHKIRQLTRAPYVCAPR